MPQTPQQETMPAQVAVRRSLSRSVTAAAIAQLLYSQHCREEERPLVQLQYVDTKVAEPFRAAGELAVQTMLHPDLERTAVMAAADIICRGSYGDNEMNFIDDLSRQTQAHYFNLAVTAIRAYRQTLVFRSPDAHLDEDYCRLLDALEQKGLVARR